MGSSQMESTGVSYDYNVTGSSLTFVYMSICQLTEK